MLKMLEENYFVKSEIQHFNKAIGRSIELHYFLCNYEAYLTQKSAKLSLFIVSALTVVETVAGILRMILVCYIESREDEMRSIPKKVYVNRLLPRYDSNRNLIIRVGFPITLLSIIFGLAPMKVQNGRYNFSVLRVVYGLVLIITSAGARLWMEDTLVHSFYSAVIYADNMILPLSCIVSLIWLSCHGNKLVHILNETVELTAYADPKQFTRRLNYPIITLGVSLLLIIATISYMCSVEDDCSDVNTIVILCLNIHLAATMCIIQMQFVLGMTVFTNILFSIQNAVTSLCPSDCNNSVLVSSADVDDIFGLYENLATLVENFANAYGCVLGVTSLMTVLHCITFAYAVTANIDVSVDPLLTVWMVILLFYEWLVLSAAENFTGRVQHICQLVYKAYRESHLKNILEQLHDFLIYLLHRKVNFSVCGLVPLNYSLMFTMAGAITTYMVILLQFQSTKVA